MEKEILSILAVGYGLLKTVERKNLTNEQQKLLDQFSKAAEKLIYKE